MPANSNTYTFCTFLIQNVPLLPVDCKYIECYSRAWKTFAINEMQSYDTLLFILRSRNQSVSPALRPYLLFKDENTVCIKLFTKVSQKTERLKSYVSPCTQAWLGRFLIAQIAQGRNSLHKVKEVIQLRTKQFSHPCNHSHIWCEISKIVIIPPILLCACLVGTNVCLLGTMYNFTLFL